MKSLNNSVIKSVIGLLTFVFIFLSCKDEEEGFAITNDLRVLQVKIDGSAEENGVSDLTVIPTVEMVFSHALSPSEFEGALTITPSENTDFAYDETGSIVTISLSDPLSYDTEYSISLPSGTYGKNGEKVTDDFAFSFTTKEFSAPTITLTVDQVSFFEGETVTVTAKASEAIFSDITMDISFAGVAQGGGVDYTASESSLTIPAGELETSFTIQSVSGDAVEGEESILISLSNVVNAISTQELTLTLGDEAPDLILRGVMELDNYINGADGRVRAVHLEVLNDIPNLGIYGIEVATNGAPPNPSDIDYTFPDMTAASAGDQLFVVRDADAILASTYFGDCYADFTVFETTAMSQNGDDAILLYKDGTAIETFGVGGVDGTGEPWEYTDSWAYKAGDEWIYAGVACVENGTGEATDATSTCPYPYCTPLQLQGVLAISWDGSGTNGGKAVHLRVNRDIADLSQYSIGVANNGGGTDGIEYTFPAQTVANGDHILLAREPSTLASYFGACANDYDVVIQSDAMNQNGDDAIELFDGADVIETYGDVNVDGSGQFWDYTGSWAFKQGGKNWVYGGVDCAATDTSNDTSACPYAFCTE